MDLSPILSHVVDELARQYPHIGIPLVRPEPLEGRADAVRFEVVRQLLDNACRYSAEGQAMMVKAREMTEASSCVTDHGTGMPRDVATRAFNRAVRGRPVAERSYARRGEDGPHRSMLPPGSTECEGS